jgi:aldose sugar dehydrogenase
MTTCWRAVAATILSAATVIRLSAQAAPVDSVGSRWTMSTEEGMIEVTVVANGFVVPSAMAGLPDGTLLVLDRHRRTLTRLDPRSGRIRLVAGVPTSWIDPAGTTSQGAGLHHVLLAPDFERSGQLFLSYSVLTDAGSTLAVARAELRADSLHRVREVYRQPEAVPKNTDHFGGRLLVSRGFLYVTTGDRFALRDSSQRVSSTLGKVLRLHDDGRVPADNPFRARSGARGEVWSLGHRNPQGLALHPRTGALWLSEHGPRGGDELNIVRRGANFGWPLVSYGEEYEGGPVGNGDRQRAGLDAPIYYFRPSIGPSDMHFFRGSVDSRWRDNLFIGAMGQRYLSRLVVDSTRVLHEERLLADRRWRVRSIAEGSNGELYVGVDGGLVARITLQAMASRR